MHNTEDNTGISYLTGITCNHTAAVIVTTWPGGPKARKIFNSECTPWLNMHTRILPFLVGVYRHLHRWRPIVIDNRQGSVGRRPQYNIARGAQGQIDRLIVFSKVIICDTYRERLARLS